METRSKSENFRINHSHWELSLYKVSFRNSKMSFSDVPERDHGSELLKDIKNAISQ
jgi:hypothetical protein